nr:MAG TPA: hypothetical protein [Bacteriophage sp.]
MRELTKKTIDLISYLWRQGWATADSDAIALIDEIVDAYKDGTVSPESCMEEIGMILKVREDTLFKGDGNE